MYNEKLIDSFLNSQYFGELKKPTASATVRSKQFGDIVKIALKINDNLIIENAKFKSFGGVFTSVCASSVCDLVTGKNILLAQKLSSEEVMKHIGDLPKEKEPMASLAVIALLEAIKKFLKKTNKNK